MNPGVQFLQAAKPGRVRLPGRRGGGLPGRPGGQDVGREQVVVRRREIGQGKGGQRGRGAGAVAATAAKRAVCQAEDSLENGGRPGGVPGGGDDRQGAPLAGQGVRGQGK